MSVKRSLDYTSARFDFLANDNAVDRRVSALGIHADSGDFALSADNVCTDTLTTGPAWYK
jgi:hypothetical protein